MRRSCTRTRWLGAIVACALAATACSGSVEGKSGGELYSQVCAVCHGADGSGSGGRPPLNAGSPASELSDDQLRDVIAVGPGAMPSFGNRLTDEQIQSLVEHIRELQAGE